MLIFAHSQTIDNTSGQQQSEVHIHILGQCMYSSTYSRSVQQCSQERADRLITSAFMHGHKMLWTSKSYFTQQSWSPHSCLLDTARIFWIDVFKQFWQQWKQHLQTMAWHHDTEKWCNIN